MTILLWCAVGISITAIASIVCITVATIKALNRDNTHQDPAIVFIPDKELLWDGDQWFNTSDPTDWPKA